MGPRSWGQDTTFIIFTVSLCVYFRKDMRELSWKRRTSLQTSVGFIRFYSLPQPPFLPPPFSFGRVSGVFVLLY